MYMKSQSGITVRVRKYALLFAMVSGVTVGSEGDRCGAQTPGTACGTTPGCAWTYVSRITPMMNPCGGLNCGSTACSGASPECGLCFPGPCIARRSRFGLAAAPPFHFLCAAPATSSCAGVESLNRPFVEANGYPCKLGLGGCVCRNELQPVTVIACPCTLSPAVFVPICY